MIFSLVIYSVFLSVCQPGVPAKDTLMLKSTMIQSAKAMKCNKCDRKSSNNHTFDLYL